MDRRYFGLKASLLGIALVATMITGFLAPESYSGSAATLQYNAGVKIEMALVHTSAKVMHAVLWAMHQLR